MSYVCLWSPSWPTGADFPADLAASLLSVAPRVAVGDRSLVWGDARGLHGGQLAEHMLRVASDYGFDDVYAGVAMTPVAAEVAATQSATRGDARLIVVKPGTDASFIAPSKLSVLSPSERLAALLQGLGIETCGALGSLDAESIEVRLGVEGVRFWQRARAEEARWLFRTLPRELPSAAIEWVEYGLKDPERLVFVINSLAGTVCTALASRGEKAREMALTFALGNRTQRSHLVRSSRPSAEQKRWMRLVREALDTITLPDAVMGVTLRVESVVGNQGAQGDLFDRGFASAPAVEDAIVQLTDDQGEVVVQAVNDEHPLLELRTQWKARSAQQSERRNPPRRGEARREERGKPASLALQLLPTPKVVTVDTEPRRDHEVPTRYLDDNEWHDLVEVAGPDRVSGGQWNAGYAREYFRCVREDGMMVWLFRGAKQQTSDWFLHGWWD
jgi:nucleotidyltransferase/DNA polymerase involved in DNA repair